MSDIPAGQPGEDELDLGEIVDDLEPEPDEPEPEIEDDEPEPDGEEPPEPVTPRQGRRGQAERLRARLERTERDLAELRTQRQQPAPAPAIDPAAAQRAEQEFFASLELMPPAEAHRAVWNRAQQQFGQQLLGQQLQTQNTLDKQAYDAEARTNPVYRRHAAAVEALVRQEHARGNFIWREAAIAHIDFQDRKARAATAAPRQQRAAARRVAGQQTRPGSTRSDGAAGGRVPADSIEAARARIAGKSLWE